VDNLALRILSSGQPESISYDAAVRGPIAGVSPRTLSAPARRRSADPGRGPSLGANARRPGSSPSRSHLRRRNRIAEITKLVARPAIANTTPRGRSELVESRARVVAASDGPPGRRIGAWTLHDGAQQRLVDTGAEAPNRTSRRTPGRRFCEPVRRGRFPSWARIIDELRDLSRGHPPPARALQGRTRTGAERTLLVGAPGSGGRSTWDCPGDQSRTDRGRGLLHRRRGTNERRQTRARHRNVLVDVQANRRRPFESRFPMTGSAGADPSCGVRAFSACETASTRLGGTISLASPSSGPPSSSSSR